MTLRMPVTEVPVGTCPDCRLTSGHIIGCTTPLLAQNLSQQYVPTGAEFDAAQMSIPAAVLDLDAPAKQPVSLDALCQDLGVAMMDMREIVPNILGTVPMSAQAALDGDQADLVREFFHTHLAD